MKEADQRTGSLDLERLRTPGMNRKDQFGGRLGGYLILIGPLHVASLTKTFWDIHMNL
ncbi:MAG TPA: hypothetical protein VLX58_15405 [Bryobacteraceae bacterium]|nr:hypothetical protein [Bryobacteraceae bacterium]